MRRLITLLVLTLILCSTTLIYAQCGGTERWFVKVGTDPDAVKIDLNTIIPISVQGLNNLPKLQGTVPRGDNKIRLDAETVVYQVKGRLVLFKFEDDNDFHLVITDDSLSYTPGGPGTDGLETGTSFIAEIPDPNCVAAKKGDPSVPSRFADKLKDARMKFETKFPGGTGADTNLGGIPVTITGILFYDRAHHQTGRAVNGVELHPILNISFDDAVTPTPTPADGEGAVIQLLANPGFEDNIAGWAGTVDDIGSFDNVSAHRGNKIAWMGGTGKAHTESLYQNVSILPSVKKATLSFWLRIETDEDSSTKKNDKLYVQIENNNGQLLKTLKTYSNLDMSDDYIQQVFDLSEYIGQSIQVFLKVVEDKGKATSFMVDDFALAAQQ